MPSSPRRFALWQWAFSSLFFAACAHDWHRGHDAGADSGDEALDAAPSQADASASSDGGAAGASDASASGSRDATEATLDAATLVDASSDARPSTDAQSDANLQAESGAPSICPADHGCPDAYPCVANPGGYTCLGQRADWPLPLRMPGSGVAAQKFAASSATLIDQVTGLMWERVESDVPRTWEMARQYCEQLTLEGYDDFRMPSHIEMATWLATDPAPQLDAALLGKAWDGLHWTVSFDRTVPTLRWVVLLSNGTIWSLLPSPEELHMVRCVRTHEARYAGTNANRTRVDAAGVLFDQATGLSWQQSIPGSARAVGFTDANNACESLDFGDKTDWRLPTLVELLTTLDLAQTGPSAVAAPFLGPIGDLDCYWSSTRRAGVAEEERFILSPGGSSYSYPVAKADAICTARCVRH